MYNLKGVIVENIKEYARDNIHVCLPAVIIDVSDYESSQFVNVSPVVAELYKDDKLLELPPILRVPIIMPSAGGGLLSFPVEEGDTVLLVIAERCIEEWKTSDGALVYPQSKRANALGDAIAIAGLYTSRTNLSPNPTDVELKFAGSSVRLSPNGDVFVDAANNLEATAGNDIKLNATNNIEIISGNSINITATSFNVDSPSFTNNSINVGSTHKHGGVTTGGATTSTPS